MTASYVRVIDVSEEPSVKVAGRRDYDPDGVHRYSFTVFTATRQLDLIASNESMHRSVNSILHIQLFGTHFTE